MSFEEWANDQPLSNRLAMANCCRNAFRGGAESRQAELDELQEMYIKQGLTIAKMQKRIDDALTYIRHTDFREVDENVVRKILKGELE